ncbi:MAG TPA: hypothetical protein ENJ12_10050, partial [Thiolapillus brandeum]|nr:hypothetical protein [Thiolapillus brandeum]
MRYLPPFFFVILLSSSAALSAATPSQAPEPTDAEAGQAAKAIPGAGGGWFAQVQKNLAQREYRLSKTADGKLQAPNRRHNLRTWFSREGVSIAERTAETAAPL